MWHTSLSLRATLTEVYNQRTVLSTSVGEGHQLEAWITLKPFTTPVWVSVNNFFPHLCPQTQQCVFCLLKQQSLLGIQANLSLTFPGVLTRADCRAWSGNCWPHTFCTFSRTQLSIHNTPLSNALLQCCKVLRSGACLTGLHQEVSVLYTVQTLPHSAPNPAKGWSQNFQAK